MIASHVDAPRAARSSRSFFRGAKFFFMFSASPKVKFGQGWKEGTRMSGVSRQCGVGWSRMISMGLKFSRCFTTGGVFDEAVALNTYSESRRSVKESFLWKMMPFSSCYRSLDASCFCWRRLFDIFLLSLNRVWTSFLSQVFQAIEILR